MDFATVKPGLYKLSSEVKNPEPDRRYKKEWRAKVSFTAGAAFKITFKREESWISHGIEIAPERDEVWLHLPADNWLSGIKLGYIKVEDGSFHDDGNCAYKALGLLIAASLEGNVPTDFDSLYTLYKHNLESYDGCRAIVKLFVQQGKLSLAEVEAAMKLVDDYTIFDAIGEQE